MDLLAYPGHEAFVLVMAARFGGVKRVQACQFESASFPVVFEVSGVPVLEHAAAHSTFRVVPIRPDLWFQHSGLGRHLKLTEDVELRSLNISTINPPISPLLLADFWSVAHETSNRRGLIGGFAVMYSCNSRLVGSILFDIPRQSTASNDTFRSSLPETCLSYYSCRFVPTCRRRLCTSGILECTPSIIKSTVKTNASISRFGAV